MLIPFLAVVFYIHDFSVDSLNLHFDLMLGSTVGMNRQFAAKFAQGQPFRIIYGYMDIVVLVWNHRLQPGADERQISNYFFDSEFF